MLICRRPLIVGVDLAGAAAVLATIALVGLLVIRPYQQARAALPRLRQELETTQRHAAGLANANQRLTAELANRQQELKDLAAQPLADVGTFLARVARLCDSNHVDLVQIEPQEADNSQGYRSWDVQVVARGAFPDFQRLVASIEATSPFVQMRTAMVIGPRDFDAQHCELGWTVRVNYLEEHETPSEVRP